MVSTEEPVFWGSVVFHAVLRFDTGRIRPDRPGGSWVLPSKVARSDVRPDPTGLLMCQTLAEVGGSTLPW